jgi:alkanesulfonate monooxygenase SsuD/methylene tetrahydromethanopterin reductase-like flavin-dependent oxidoreductase (luciferase family)
MPRVCAEFGDGFALSPHCGADGIAQEIMAITAERFAERGRDFAKIPKARCIGVIFANEDVDVAEYKKKLLLEAKSRTEIERVGQYWTDIAHKQWPQYFPKVWNYEKFYDLYDAVLCGSPAQVAQQIKERVFDLGFTEVQVWPNGLLRSPEKRSIENQGETIERFANEVIPLLK